MKQWQKYLAEVFGTFILVLVGTTSILAAGTALGSGSAAELVAPFGFGLALLAGLYAFGEISGGHFNPAVSLAMYLDRRLSASDLVGYWIAQFVGAVLASALMLLPFTDEAIGATTTKPNPTLGDASAFAIEVMMTAVFVVVILQATKSKGFGSSALVAIPLTLLTIHFAAIPFSGSSVNPARTLGPSLVSGEWDATWIYFLGPAVGAIIAWVVHTVVVKGEVDLGGGRPKATAEGGGETQ